LTATSATITGSVTITGGSGIGNLSDAGDLAKLDKVGASNCNTTIISGGKIITGLLTASNIQTGTLNASVVTVSNLNATNITAGTLSVDRIASNSITSDKIFALDGSKLSNSSVTVGKLSINSYLEMNNQAIYKCSTIRNSMTAQSHELALSSDKWWASSSNYLEINADGYWKNTADITLDAGDDIFIEASGGYITLDATNIKMDFGGTNVTFQQAQTVNGQWGKGYIGVKVGSTTRYIMLKDTV